MKQWLEKEQTMVDIQIRNKELIEKYPWLCPERKDDGSIAKHYDYSYTELDFLPKGWHNMVLEMCEKLKPMLEKHGLFDTYALSEVKEKWGALCWYDYILDFHCDIPWDVRALTYDYFDKSKETCIVCGAQKTAEKFLCEGCEYDRWRGL